MPEPDQSEILHQLAETRRELRVVRGLLVFVSVAAGIFLFAPALAVRVAVVVARAWELLAGYAAPAIGLIAAVIVAAVVVSRRASRGQGEASRVAEKPVA